MINFRNAKFFSVEGQDGSGKDTAAEGLVRVFEDMGYIVKIHTPYYNFNITKRVKDAIVSDELNPTGQIYSLVMCRFLDMVRIEKSLIEDSRVKSDFSNVIIIANRYIDSTYAYQCYAKNGGNSDLLIKWSDELELPIPDITFYLDCPVDVLISRLNASGKELDQHETAGVEFFERVSAGFIESLRETYEGLRDICIVKSTGTKEDTLKTMADYAISTHWILHRR